MCICELASRTYVCMWIHYYIILNPRFCYIIVHCIHLGIITYKRIFDLESSTYIKHNKK